jgi:hypothetical protein
MAPIPFSALSDVELFKRLFNATGLALPLNLKD